MSAGEEKAVKVVSVENIHVGQWKRSVGNTNSVGDFSEIIHTANIIPVSSWKNISTQRSDILHILQHIFHTFHSLCFSCALSLVWKIIKLIVISPWLVFVSARVPSTNYGRGMWLCRIAKRGSDVVTQTNSHKQNGMIEDLTIFQARKHVFRKQFLKRKFGVHSPPVSLRKRLCCLPDFLGVPIISILLLDFARFAIPFF